MLSPRLQVSRGGRSSSLVGTKLRDGAGARPRTRHRLRFHVPRCLRGDPALSALHRLCHAGSWRHTLASEMPGVAVWDTEGVPLPGRAREKREDTGGRLAGRRSAQSQGSRVTFLQTSPGLC